MDGQNLYSAILGGAAGDLRRTSMAMRVLPAQFFQFPQPERSVHVQALETLRQSGRGLFPRGHAGTRRFAIENGLANSQRVRLARSWPQRRPGFTARLNEPPACAVFDLQPDVFEF